MTTLRAPHTFVRLSAVVAACALLGGAAPARAGQIGSWIKSNPTLKAHYKQGARAVTAGVVKGAALTGAVVAAGTLMHMVSVTDVHSSLLIETYGTAAVAASGGAVGWTAAKILSPLVKPFVYKRLQLSTIRYAMDHNIPVPAEARQLYESSKKY